MGKCRVCGKQTLEGFDLCPQCYSPGKGGGKKWKEARKHGSAQAFVQPKPTGLKPEYLKEGYFDVKNGKRYIKKELYTTEAVYIAGLLSDKGMTLTALRRFYNKLKGISTRYGAGEDFDLIKEKLYSFLPNVIYVVNRESSSSTVPREFQEFIERNIAEAEKGFEYFKAFEEHFMSVLAYFKEKDSKNRR